MASSVESDRANSSLRFPLCLVWQKNVFYAHIKQLRYVKRQAKIWISLAGFNGVDGLARDVKAFSKIGL